ncbi:MAG: hypothetical protein EOO10_06260 [Chitinophagaceae bacterium]|nr:MAG: hypothetical protein EOO10_06260 [Chitinophagaceae bacterium]
MKIKGIKGMTIADIQNEVLKGGRFVSYSYCISFIMMSMKRSSGIYFIKSDENGFTKGTPFTFISFLFGWWGIPWGIIYTIECLLKNTNGGIDVTDMVMRYLQQPTKGHVFDFEAQPAFAY